METKILSIQSHVVSGYIGNKAAVFPLQLFGYEVDYVNTVQLSNHTQYKNKWTGQILGALAFESIMKSLRENKLDAYTHLLTGFVPDLPFLERVLDTVVYLKKKYPQLIYLCDPVLGNKGLFFLPKDMIKVYREKLFSLADIVTPSQFEIEKLTDVKIKSEVDALKAISLMHGFGAKTVILSSFRVPASKNLVMIGSVKGSNSYIRITFPHLDVSFVGAGDLFASLVLAWYINNPKNLRLTCEKAISTMIAVLKRTIDLADNQADAGCIELKLIQSKCDIESPNICVKADVIKGP